MITSAIFEPYPDGYHSSLQKRQVARILWFLCQEDNHTELERSQHLGFRKEKPTPLISLTALNQLLTHAPSELFEGQDWNELALKAVNYLIDILQHNRQPTHQKLCRQLHSVDKMLKNLHY